jgi:hypothetical protein
MANALRRQSFPALLVNPFRKTSEGLERRFSFAPSRMAWLIPLALSAALLVISAVGWVVDPPRFYFAYLVGWTFCLSIALGSMFFVMINHITRASWSVVVRRITETTIWWIPMLAILSIPIFIGIHELYGHWTNPRLFDPNDPYYDPLVAGKQAYLNIPFFVIRVLIYFGAWTLIAYKLYSLSIRQDVDPAADIPAAQRRVSAWGIPLFAITLQFASFDFLMTLDPHWFSTIFGVYYFSGSFGASLAFLILTLVLLQKRAGTLNGVVTREHYHDLGKFLFAFTVFWAYIAFSQYMLIWYANIPEETIWYRHRLEHGWEYHSVALGLFRFVLPFFILMLRSAKRSLPVLSIMSVWILVMHWFDLHWLAMPVHALDHLGGHSGIHLIDVAVWLGLFGLFISMLIYQLSRHSLVPRNDPYLDKSVHFENV